MGNSLPELNKMNTFWELSDWLYPAVMEAKSFQNSKPTIHDFIEINRILLKTGREEGFFLAMKCINKDRAGYATALRSLSWQDRFPKAAIKSTKISKAALASALANKIQDSPNGISNEDKSQLRSRLQDVIDCCIPTILWCSLCDLEAYALMADQQAPQLMGELLYCYTLTFSRGELEVASIDAAHTFIQTLAPLERLGKWDEPVSSHQPYSRIIEARKKVLRRSTEFSSTPPATGTQQREKNL